MPDFIQDDMEFSKYMDCGYQCKMKVKSGIISVRFGCKNLITDTERPYEVWYPLDDTPTGYQTAEDIWNYIKSNA